MTGILIFTGLSLAVLLVAAALLVPGHWERRK